MSDRHKELHEEVEHLRAEVAHWKCVAQQASAEREHNANVAAGLKVENARLYKDLAEQSSFSGNMLQAAARQRQRVRKLEADNARLREEVERLKTDRDEWKIKHWKAHDDFHRAFLNTPEARAALAEGGAK